MAVKSPRKSGTVKKSAIRKVVRTAPLHRMPGGHMMKASEMGSRMGPNKGMPPAKKMPKARKKGR